MFVDKVISLVFNMLSRLVITSLPKSKYLLIAWLQSTSAVILEPRRVKSAAVSTLSPSICHEVTEPDAMILVFWILSFKPTFSFSSFTFIKRRFTSSSISATRVMSSAYLRLLVFLPAILIPACPSILQIREKKKKTHKNETRKKKGPEKSLVLGHKENQHREARPEIWSLESPPIIPKALSFLPLCLGLKEISQALKQAVQTHSTRSTWGKQVCDLGSNGLTQRFPVFCNLLFFI